MLKKILIGAFVLFFSAAFLSENASKWEIAIDTRGYLGASLKKPWGSKRTPGLKYYIKALGQFDPIFGVFHPPAPEFAAYTRNALADEKADKALLFVSRANFLLLITGLAFLGVSLSLHVNMPLAMAAPALILALTPLPDTSKILTEPLGAALLLAAVSFGLCFAHGRKLIFLLALAVVSAYAFLLRPAMIFMPVLAGLIILAVLAAAWRRKQKARAWLTMAIGLLLLLGTAILPWRLYSQSGLFVTSQAQSTTDIMRAIYLLQPGDENLFTQERDKSYVIRLLELKPEFDRIMHDEFYPMGRDKYSKVYRLVGCFDRYYYRGFFYDEYKKLYPDVIGKYKNNALIQAIIAKDLARPIVRNHFAEYLTIAGCSFLSAWNFYPDTKPSIFGKKIRGLGIDERLVPFIFILFLLIIAASLWAGTPALKLPILFIGAIHPLAVLIISFGLGVIPRYLELTEWCLSLAVILAIHSLLTERFFTIIRREASL